MTRPADFLPLFGDLPPYRPPGECFQYSNAGYIVLGLVIEELTGQAYTDVVQERVFDPAGMSASGFFRLDEPVPDVAVGYLPRVDPTRRGARNVYSIPVIGGAGRWRDLHRARPRPVPARVRGRDSAGDAARCRPDPARRRRRRASARATACTSTPTAVTGTAAATPASRLLAYRWPEEDVHLVVLMQHRGRAGRTRSVTR